MEKISWTDRVKSKELLHRGEDERNTLQRTKRREDNWVGHILRRNCLLNMPLKERWKDGSEGKTRKKKSGATGRPYGNERLLEIERGSTRSHSEENSLRKWL